MIAVRPDGQMTVSGGINASRTRRSVAVVTRRWQLPAWLIRHMPECIYRKMG